MPASGAVTPPRCHTHALGHPGGAARAAEPSRRLLPLADHDRRPDPARAGARQVQAERGPLSTGAFSPAAVTPTSTATGAASPRSNARANGAQAEDWTP